MNTIRWRSRKIQLILLFGVVLLIHTLSNYLIVNYTNNSNSNQYQGNNENGNNNNNNANQMDGKDIEEDDFDYQSLPNLTVHLIPHSHCDPGWIYTVDEYYQFKVQHILNTVTEALYNDQTKTFVWSEIGFFEKWWNLINEDQRQRFKTIVKRNQIEFVGGGIVQNDETLPTLTAIITQMSQGHRFLMENFGVKPETAWQIDPFGHSMVTPTVYSRMGIKQLVLNRIYKKEMVEKNQLQFIWRGNPRLGDTADIFAHIFDDFYTFPSEFSMYFEWDHTSESLASQVNKFIKMTRKRQRNYGDSVNHILIPMGDDFAYVHDWVSFSFVDVLLSTYGKYAKDKGVKLIYSTPKQYFKSLYNDWIQPNQIQFKYYDGDLLPYTQTEKGEWWTGFYTTHPLLKGELRKTESNHRVAELLSNYNQQDLQSNQMALAFTRRDISTLQHHDAITGTSKQHVVDDYLGMLSRDNYILKLLSTTALSFIFNQVKVKEIIQPIDFKSISLPIIIFNSLNWKRKEIYSIRVFIDPKNQLIKKEKCPISVWYNEKQSIDFDCVLEDGNDYIRLDFPIELQPFEMKTIFIKQLPPKNQTLIRPLKSKPLITILENEKMKLQLKQYNNLISSIQLKSPNNTTTTIGLNQQLMAYMDSGGAYIFKPDGDAFSLIDQSKIIKYSYWNSRYIKENRFTYTNSLKEHQEMGIKIHSNSNMIYINYTVRGQPNHSNIMRFATDLKTKSTIYTDNGLDVVKRLFKLDSEIAQNYYPSVSFSYIKDNQFKFICLNDRSRGVTSSTTKQGVLELGIHRNLHQDDHKGLGDINQDNSLISTELRCLLDKDDSISNMDIRKLSLMQENPLKSYYVDGGDIEMNNLNFIPLNAILPESIHILSYSKNESIHFIRLWNIDENNSVEVTISNLFTSIEPKLIWESDLTGYGDLNQQQHQKYHHYQTNYEPFLNYNLRMANYQSYMDRQSSPIQPGSNFKITLMSLEIKSIYVIE